MIRRLSASFFLLGMAVLVLLQQPVLAYCPHTNQFFISECGCAEKTAAACPHCQEEQPADPCDKCSDKIQLDVDDLVWFDLALNAPTEIPSPLTDGESDPVTFSPATDFSVAPIRPPPPPPGVALFLLNSVFRL
jgi:hypothetical protein